MLRRRRIALTIVVTCATAVAAALAYRWACADGGPTADEFRVYAAFLTRLSEDWKLRPEEIALARTTSKLATPLVGSWVPAELRPYPIDKIAPPMKFVSFCGNRCGRDFMRKNLREYQLKSSADVQFPFDVVDASGPSRTTARKEVVRVSRPGFDLWHHHAVLTYCFDHGVRVHPSHGMLCVEAGSAFFEKVNGRWKVARYGSDSGGLDQQLLQAARNGDTASVRQLLKKGANIETKDQGGSTPLALALNYGYADMVDLLLERGADPVAGGLKGDDVLVNAARQGNPKKIELLLERGADPKSKDQALLATAELAFLAIEISPEEAERLRSQREHDPRGTPPRFPVVDAGQTARLLIEHGANIEARDVDGSTPLIRAAGHGATDVVKVLLEKGANIEATDSGGDTALIAAACVCAVIDMPDTFDSMKLLLGKKANVNARAKDGATALMAAAGWGRTHIVQLLLDNRAQIDARDYQGNTALLIAASGSALPTADTVKLLLARGARIEARNKLGDTALILSASGSGYEDAKITELLLDAGADVNAKNNQGYTALALAAKKGRTEIVSLLKKASERTP